MKWFLLVSFISIFFAISCSESTNSDQTLDGKTVYAQQCSICHGGDGKLGISGAKDLSVSVMNLEERIAIIKNGKGGMTPFQGMIKDAEITAVAEYISTLRK